MTINANRETCKAAASILLAGSENDRKPFSRRNFSLKIDFDIENDSTPFLIYEHSLWA